MDVKEQTKVEEFGPWRCRRCESELGMFAKVDGQPSVLLPHDAEKGVDYMIPHNEIIATCGKCKLENTITSEEWREIFDLKEDKQ